jgi:hypothetical protein
MRPACQLDTSHRTAVALLTCLSSSSASRRLLSRQSLSVVG